MSKEVWKKVKGFEGYYMVSNLGRVKSLKRIIKRGDVSQTINEKILKQYKDKDGYYSVRLNKDGKGKTFKIYWCVLGQ